MFTGEHRHTLDAKGRLTLPSKYRPQLAAGLTVTKGEDFCLHIYPDDIWRKKVEHVLQTDIGSKEARNYRRALLSGADETELDGQGRVLLRDVLRDFGELDKDCVVIGVGEFIEVWSAPRWEEQRLVSDAAIGNRDEVTPDPDAAP